LKRAIFQAELASNKNSGWLDRIFDVLFVVEIRDDHRRTSRAKDCGDNTYFRVEHLRVAQWRRLVFQLARSRERFKDASLEPPL